MSGVKLLFGNLAVLLGLLLVCAIAGEILVRLAPTPNDQVERNGRLKYRFNPYRTDGLLGWSLRPDWETVHQTGDFSAVVRTDERGLRHTRQPVATGAGKPYRILVVGDSFAFGWGVADDETFSALLARRLQPPVGASHIEVLNAGVAGWSADHYGLFLKERGLAFEPDLVLMVPSENDPSDLAVNRLTLGEDGLPTRTASALRMIDQAGRMRYLDDGPYLLPSFDYPGQLWLAEHSELYHWLRYRLARVWLGWAHRRISAEREEQAGEPPEGSIESLSSAEITRGLSTGRRFQLHYHQFLMADLARAVAERGAVLRTLLVTRSAASDPDGSASRALLEACLRDSECAASEEILSGQTDVFFPNDGHWTARGHERIADGLIEFLGRLPTE